MTRACLSETKFSLTTLPTVLRAPCLPQAMYDVKPEQRDNYFVRTYPQASGLRILLLCMSDCGAFMCTS